MARTDAGAALTIAHRQAQVRLQARATRDFTTLWPLWQGDRASFERLVEATLPLVLAHRETSSALGTAYFESFRRAEGVGGAADARPASALDRKKVIASLYVTGEVMTRKAVLAGFSPQAAMQNALVRTAGAVTRHVLSGGREAVARSSNEDPRSVGWFRVASDDACAFCAMIAAQGARYGEGSVAFEAHDHCSCTGEPAYEGSQMPGRGQEYRELWQEVASGEPDPLNAFRRRLES